MTTATIGDLLKTWRARRARSQLALAVEVGVSTRHLSFVETGRSRPSPELVLALAHHLDVPLRDRNTMLLAAGYAPRFSTMALDDDTMTTIRASLRRILDTHDPYPGLVLDRHWNIVMTNRAAGRLVGLLPPHLAREPINLFRASLDPDGLARHTTNLDVWAPYLLGQLDRLVAQYGDEELHRLSAELRGTWPAESTGAFAGGPVVTCDLEVAGHPMSLYTTLTTFGSARDVTLDELLVELFFPADATTDETLTALDG